MIPLLIDVFKQTLLVSGFVLFLMLTIEFINVRTKEKWSRPLKNSRFVQLIVSSVVGAIPGCAGIFATVSLFTHNIINFSSLLGSFIATTGDEAFVMLTLIPQTAWKIMLLTFSLAILTGVILNLLIKKKTEPVFEKHLVVHGDECCAKGKHEHHQHEHEKKYGFTFARSMFVAILILILGSQFAELGQSGGGHDHELFSFESIAFILLGLVSLLIIIIVPEHFLMEHLWAHVLKKHFVRLILWTFGAFVFIAVMNRYFPVNEWFSLNPSWLLGMAILVGLLPTSGPHIIFITLFMQGIIPFSVLLVNSIVQDGHAGIPLLAEDKLSFLKIKGIKILIGLLVGAAGRYFSF
jgi:hypothetical protein